MILRLFSEGTLIEKSINNYPFSIGCDKNDTFFINKQGITKKHLVINRKDEKVIISGHGNIELIKNASNSEKIGSTGSELSYDGLYIFNDVPNTFALFIDETALTNETLSLSQKDCITIGRKESSDIRIEEQFVSKTHLSIKKIANKYVVRDENSTNGTFVKGKAISETTLCDGDEILFGNATITINGEELNIRCPGKVLAIKKTEPVMREFSKILNFTRAPRIKSVVPSENVEIDSPLGVPEKPQMNWLSVIAPPIMSLIISVVMVVALGNYMMLVSAPLTVFGVVVSIINYKKQTRDYVSQLSTRKKQYHEYLEERINLIEKLQNRQNVVANRANPSIDACIDIVCQANGKLWERRFSDDDFATVRLGSGEVEFGGTISVPTPNSRVQTDELTTEAMEIYTKYHLVPNQPVCCDLCSGYVTGLSGNKTDAVELIKNIIVSLCTQHYYNELKIALFCRNENIRDIEWIRKIPHFAGEEKGKIYLATTNAEAEKLSKQFVAMFKERLNQKEADSYSSHHAIILPFVLFVVVDGDLIDKKNPVNEYLYKADNLNTCSLVCADNVNYLPKECTQIIEINGKKGFIYNKNNASDRVYFETDAVRNGGYELFGRAIENIICDENTVRSLIPAEYSFFDMYGLSDIADYNLEAAWSAAEPENTLAAPIGIGETGELVYLDLHEKYHGPHGLLAGTTGSGKSEVLLSYVLSMVMHYHPYEVGFMVIDFKGGGMADRIEKLPHFLGSISNLEGNEISRSLLFIQAEKNRRQNIFKQNKINDISEYISLYKKGVVKTPVPHLIMIVDEFAELKAQHPEYIDELISAARVGRSLGLHLILATQKPSGQVNEQIWSNSKFRICLKVATREDSEELLKNPLAATIKEAGRGYLQVGNGELFELFQSGYSGMPICERFGKAYTQLDAVVDRVAEFCAEKGIERLNSVCLPPLPVSIDVPENQPDYPIEKVPIGILDAPEAQRQDVAFLDFCSQNSLIIGSSRTGKTNFIQLLIRQLTANHSPKEINLYLLDFGTMFLRNFSELHHVGGVVTAEEKEKLRNLFKLLNSEMAKRKQMFAEKRITSFASYKEAGYSDIPQIILCIDGYSAFKEIYGDAYEDNLTVILRDGLTYGISAVITNTVANGFSHRFMSAIGGRYAFSCTDSSEYIQLFDTGKKAPANVRGRVICKIEDQLFEMQTYLAFAGEKEHERAANVERFITVLNERYLNDRAKQIPSIPDRLTVQYLRNNFEMLSNGFKYAFAMDYLSVEPEYLDFDNNAQLYIIGRDANAKKCITQSILELLLNDSAVRPVEAYVIDSIERPYKCYAEHPLVNTYTVDYTEIENIFSVVEQKMEERYNSLIQTGLETIVKLPLILVLVNHRDVMEYISSNKSLLEKYRKYMKRYKNLGLAFVFSDIDNVPLPYGAPEFYKDIKNCTHLLSTDKISDFKLFALEYASENSKLSKEAQNDDLFFLNGSQWKRVKAVEGFDGR